jgi:hypothetical protein
VHYASFPRSVVLGTRASEVRIVLLRGLIILDDDFRMFGAKISHSSVTSEENSVGIARHD